MFDEALDGACVHVVSVVSGLLVFLLFSVPALSYVDLVQHAVAIIQ